MKANVQRKKEYICKCLMPREDYRYSICMNCLGKLRKYTVSIDKNDLSFTDRLIQKVL